MAKRNPKRYRPPANYAAQPRIAQIVRLLKRQRGCTAAEAAKATGWNDASIRCAIVRLGQVGAEVVGQREERRYVYRLVERTSGRKDRTRLTKAQAAKLDRQRGFKPRLGRK